MACTPYLAANIIGWSEIMGAPPACIPAYTPDNANMPLLVHQQSLKMVRACLLLLTCLPDLRRHLRTVLHMPAVLSACLHVCMPRGPELLPACPIGTIVHLPVNLGPCVACLPSNLPGRKCQRPAWKENRFWLPLPVTWPYQGSDLCSAAVLQCLTAAAKVQK